MKYTNPLTYNERLDLSDPNHWHMEKIYDLGNVNSISTVKNIPDIKFSLLDYMVSAE